MSILERLRARRGHIGRATLMLVAFVWVGASASPCLGMTADTVMDGPETGHHEHDDSADHPTPTHEHDCPHCPPASTGGEDNRHITCDTSDDLNRTSGSQKVETKPLFIATAAPLWSAAVRSSSASGLPLESRLGAPPTPLNLQYCVFLN